MTERDGERPATHTSAAAPARAPAVIAMLGVLGAVAAAGCSDSAPHGPPVLLQVYWETRGAAPVLIWSSTPTDNPLPTTVSPAATQFDLVFDRVIDGSKIEDTKTVNGVATQVPKMQPSGGGDGGATTPSPVSVSWPGMADGVAALAATNDKESYDLEVWYNSISLPAAPAGSSYVYGRETPSYPSETPLTINIVPDGITSKYNEPMAPIDPLVVTTQPFGVMINPTSGAAPGPGTPLPTYVPTNFWVPLQFNNVPLFIDPSRRAAALSQYLQVRQNGVLLTPGQYQLQASASDPTLILLQPGSIQIWDSGGRLDVTLSADLPDVYGTVLGQDTTASFLPCQLVGEDAGVRICAPPPIHGCGSDAGATDGGAGDAPAAADAGGDADDAGIDSAVD